MLSQSKKILGNIRKEADGTPQTWKDELGRREGVCRSNPRHRTDFAGAIRVDRTRQSEGLRILDGSGRQRSEDLKLGWRR